MTSEYLKWEWDVYIDRNIYIPVGAEARSLGSLVIRCSYTCNKSFLKSYLKKCEDDFKIQVDVQCYKGKGKLILKESSSDGKLKVKVEDSNTVDVGVGRGKGSGRLILKYDVIYEPQTDEYKEILNIFVYKIDKTGKTRMKIFEKQIDINVIDPFEIEYEILPKSNVYFVGDNVKLILMIKPKYIGQFEITANTKKRIDIKELKPHIVEFDLNLKNKDDIKISVYVPELNYGKNITIPLTIKEPPRLEIRSVNIEGDVIPGSRPIVKVDLFNMSPSTAVDATINITAYGVSGSKDAKIKPNENATIQIRLPPIQFKETFEKIGSLKVIEFGKYISEKTFSLEEVKQFPFDIEMEEKVTLFSSKQTIVTLKLKNNSLSDVNVKINCSKSNICDIDFHRIVNVPASTIQDVEVKLTPRKIGKDKVTFQIDVKSDDVPVKRLEKVLKLEILPSFSIENVEVIQPSTKDRILLGQEIALQLDIVSYLDDEFEIKANGVTIDTNQQVIVRPGKSKIMFSGIAKELGKVKIVITDGIFSHQVELPTEIVKPYVVLSKEDFEIYGGIETYLRIGLENPFDAPIIVSYNVYGGKDIAILTEELKPIRTLTGRVKLPPLSMVEIPLNILAKKAGEKKVVIELEAMYGTIVGDKIKDELTILVKRPLEVIAKPNSLNISFPYPPSKTVFDSDTFRKQISLIIINKTDYPLGNIRISLGLDNIDVEPNIIEIPMLSSRQQKIQDVNLNIPFATALKNSEMLVRLNIREIYEDTLTIFNLSINRNNMFSVVYHTNTFSKDCNYPFVEMKDYIEVLVPIGYNLDTLGKPIEVYSTLNKLLLYSANILRKIKPKDIWSATAKYIYESINPNGKPKDAYHELKSMLNAYPHRVENIVIVPTLIWKIAICKFISYNSYLNNLIDELKQIKPGIISISLSSQVYSLRNTLYERIVNVLKGEESVDALKDLSNEKIWEAGDIATLYTLIAKDSINYNKDVANYLKNINKTGYILYICSSGWNGILNEDNLKTLLNFAKSLQNSKIHLALSLLYMFSVNKCYKFKPEYKPIISFIVR